MERRRLEEKSSRHHAMALSYRGPDVLFVVTAPARPPQFVLIKDLPIMLRN
jgi:hypothetical protein